MSSPDKLHRNDKGKHHRKRQRPKGARRADQARDDAADQDASKRLAKVALNNAAKADTDLMKPSDANGVAKPVAAPTSDTDLMKPSDAKSSVASASDTDLMKPDFASDSRKPAAAKPVGNDTDLMKPDFASKRPVGNDTDLMKPDFASDNRKPAAAKPVGNDTDLMKPDFAANTRKPTSDTDLMKPDFASAPKDARLAGIVADLEVGPVTAKPAVAHKDARLESIVADLEVGPTNGKPAGVGKPPDPKQNAEVMQMFREVNGDQGRGAPPSAENRAEVMQMFREVNGDQGRGAPPDPKQNADVMEMFREVNDPAFDSKGKNGKESPQQPAQVGNKPKAGDPRLEGIVADLEVGPAPNAKPAGVGKPPDPKQNADVMEMFREVNDPAFDSKGKDDKQSPQQPAQVANKPAANGVGKPPDPKQNADVMEMFREVNDPAFDSKGKNGKESPQQPAHVENKPKAGDPRLEGIVADLEVGPAPNAKPAGVGKPPDPKQNADVMEMFREVNDPAFDSKGKDDKQSPQQPAQMAKAPDADVLAMFNEASNGYDQAHHRKPHQHHHHHHKHDQSPSVKDRVAAIEAGPDTNASPQAPADLAIHGPSVKDRVAGFEAGHLMNAPLGGAEMPLNLSTGTQASNAHHSASAETNVREVMQHANDLDPTKRLAKVAIAQVEESLETKNPAQKKKKDDAKDVKQDAKHDHKENEKHEHETEEKTEDKVVEKKPELAGHDENVKDAAHDGADHVHHLGDQLSAKNAHDAKNLTLDAKLQKGPQPLVAGVQNGKLGLPAGKDPLHLIDGHATGLLGAIHDAKQPLKVDGHGTGLVDDKHGPNQKVDGHGTGLELGNDPLHKQAKNDNAADGGETDIADSQGNVQKYDPMSGKAPAPQGKPSAGGFAKPAPKPELPPPPQTANQQALNSFIEKARADRDAARKSVKATQLAKSTAITVDASHLKSQVEAKNATALAKIKKDAEAAKAKAAQEAAEKQKTEGPVTVESLKEKLEAKATEDRTKLKVDFDAKTAELKTRLDSQKAVLKGQIEDQVKAIQADQKAKKEGAEKAFAAQKKSLEKTRDDLVTEIRKNVAKDQTALEKEMQKGGKLWTAANAKIDKIKADSQANQDKTHNDGYAKADKIQTDATKAGQDERSKGATAGSKAYADVMAKKKDDSSFLGDMALENEARGASAAARAPFDQRARDLETKGKLDCTSMKATIDAQVKKLKTDGEAAVKAVNDATAGQVKAIETKIQDLSKIADGRIKKAEDDYVASVAKKQDELNKAVDDSTAKIQKLKDEGEQKLAKLETESVGKLQKDYDASLKAIDTRVQTAEKQLAASNGKNLKALEQMVNQTCAAIDKQVVDTEKKFDHTVQDADKQASAFIAQQLAKVQAEAQHALDAIDKTYQECLKMADDAVEAAHRQMEDASKGKMLEIEVHIGTMMKDCGDSSRYDAAYGQLEYYVKNKLPIPAGYGEAPPPPSAEAKKEDAQNKGAPTQEVFKSADGDAKKPTDPKQQEEDKSVSKEMRDFNKDEKHQKELLESNDLSNPEVLKAHVEEQMKKGQTATGAAAAESAQHSIKKSMAEASETVQKAFNTKADEMKKVEEGNPDALKEVREQERAEDDAKKRADAAKEAMDKKGLLWGKNPDKKAVLKAMEGMTPAEAEAFKSEMKARGVDMDQFVNSELNEDQKKEATLRLKGDDVGADIAALNAAKGHHMTGNEKLAATIGAGLILGPFGAVAVGGATSGDQNIGADKERINELLNKYKDNPAKLQQLKEALEKDGVSIAQLCHETGNDALGKSLDPEHVESTKKPDELKSEGKNQAQALLDKNPKLNDPASRNKLDAAAAKAEQSLHYILDSSKNEGIADALKDLTPEEAAYVKAKYKANTGHDLEADMNHQLSGVGLSTAKASLRADKDTLALNKILGAEEAGWTKYTLDDDKMKAAMKDLKDPAERQKVLDAYERKTGKKLTDVLNEKMSGNDRDIAVAYAEGNIAKAAAAEADEALNGGWMNSMHRAIHDRTKQFTGQDIDTESFTRPLVGAMVNPTSLLTPSMDKDTKVNLPGGYEMQSGAIHKVDTDKLLEIMESMPNPEDRQKFKEEYEKRTGHNLDDDVKQKTSGVTQGAFSDGKPSIKFDAYKALDDGRMDDYYAAKMDDAVDGMNDSKAFHKTLEGKSERERSAIIAAYKKRHPEDADAFNHMLEEQFGKDSLDYQKAQMLATLKDDPKTGAVKLPDEFVIRYAEDSVWSRTAKQIDSATAIFDKYPILYALPIVGQAAGEAKAASYFMRGWGVDKDAIKEVLKGKSKAEIDEIRKKYKDAPGGGDLDADLGYVLDGRDAFEVNMMLEKGEPTNDKERIERQIALYNFDRGHDGSVFDKLGMKGFSNGITDLLSPAGRQMDDNHAEMERLLALVGKDGNLPASEKGNLGGATGAMEASTKGFMDARQEITGAIATAAGAIVGAVVTVLTGGAAAPILAALAAGLTTVAVKTVMLGNSYGRSELGVDLAMTAVQMATAGLGGELGEFGKTFLGQVLNGAIGAAASNFAQTAMTSADAHDLLNLLAQASKSGLVGMLSGGANAGATAALGHAMESLSETAFGPHAPLGGIMIKGMVTGAGSSLASTFAEAIVDPDSLKGDWDKVFAKLAQGAAQGAFQNALNDVASAHRERIDAVHERAKKAVDEVRKANGGKPNPEAEHAAFAKALGEGYDAVIADERAAEAAKKQKQADPAKVEQQLEQNPKPPSSEDRVVNPNEDKQAQAAKQDKVGPHGQSPEEVRAQMEKVAAAAPKEEAKPQQHEKNPIEEKLAQPEEHKQQPKEEKVAQPKEENPLEAGNSKKKEEQQHANEEQHKALEEQKHGTAPKEAGAVQGPVVDRYGAQVEPHGLADPATMDAYIDKMKKVQSEWPSMSPNERMKAIASALNEQLMSHGLAPIDMQSPSGMHPQMEGQHQYGPGTIHINEILLNNPNPTTAEFANIANKMYHEARHAEQWHLMVKHLESTGMNVNQIAAAMHMDPRFVHQSLEMKVPMSPERLADGAKYYDAIYGAGAAHRNDVLGRLATDPAAYEQYRSLVEERDAWAVGDHVGRAYENRPQEQIVPTPIVAIGGENSATVNKPIEGQPIKNVGGEGTKPVVVGKEQSPTFGPMPGHTATGGPAPAPVHEPGAAPAVKEKPLSAKMEERIRAIDEQAAKEKRPLTPDEQAKKQILEEAVVRRKQEEAMPAVHPGDDEIKVYRHDNDFNAELNHRGQKKTHLNESGNLTPANHEGGTSVLEHIIGKVGDAKDNSPFTSFGTQTNGEIGKKFGEQEVVLDHKRLQADIAEGKVQGVEVLRPEKIQELLRGELDGVKSALEAKGHEIKSFDLEAMKAAHAKGRQGLEEFIEKNVLVVADGTSKGKTRAAKEELFTVLNAIGNSSRDGEWLIKGQIPKEYFHGPHPAEAVVDPTHHLGNAVTEAPKPAPGFVAKEGGTPPAKAEEIIQQHNAKEPLTKAERAQLEQLLSNNPPEKASADFETWRKKNSTAMPSAEQQRANGQHGQIEVHNHMTGNVPVDDFVPRLEAAGLKPHGDQVSKYEPLLEAIDQLRDMPGLAHKMENGQIADKGRGKSGEALMIVEGARAKIAEIKADIINKGLTGKDLEAAHARIDDIAKNAVNKAMRATEHTDFNSAYEIRDELVKKYYGQQEGVSVLKDSGIKVENWGQVDLANPAHRDALAKNFEGRPGAGGKDKPVLGALEHAGAIAEKLEAAQKAHEAGVPGAAEEVKKYRAELEKQKGIVMEQLAYDGYTSDTLKRLAGDDVRYTELSNSLNKLDKRFDENQIPKLKEKLIEKLLNESPPNIELARKIENLDVKQLAMMNTADFGSQDHNVNHADGGVPDRTKKEWFDANVGKLEALLSRKDVVGMDIAGMEQLMLYAKNDPEGRQRLESVLKKIVEHANESKERIVFRPHVGEGAVDTTPHDLFHANANNQVVDNKPSHYNRAHENVGQMLELIKTIAVVGPDGKLKLPENLEVRFGHATHTDAEQAAAMGQLGVVAEVNLESNHRTASVTDRDSNIGPTDRQVDPRTEHQNHFETDPTKSKPRLDDHALPQLIMNDVRVILSTDGADVMSTNLGNEYKKAAQIVEQIKNNEIPIPLTAEQSKQFGGKEKITYGELKELAKNGNAEAAKKVALFDNAMEKFYNDAHDYHSRRPKQGGGEAPMAAPGFAPPPEHAPKVSDAEARAAVAEQEKATKQQPYDRAQQQQEALAAATPKEKDGKADPTRAQRDLLVEELRRQVQHSALAAEVVRNSETGQTTSVVSVVFGGIKHMNDDLVGQPINTGLLRERDRIVREVIKEKFGDSAKLVGGAGHDQHESGKVVDQTYKSSTIAAAGEPHEVAAKMKEAMQEIDRRMQAEVLKTLDQGKRYWEAELKAAEAKEPKDQGAIESAKKRLKNIGEERARVDGAGEEGFRFDMSAGVSKVHGAEYEDVLAADMDANKAARTGTSKEGAAKEGASVRAPERELPKVHSHEEYMQYVGETIKIRDELKSLSLPFYGLEDVPIMVGDNVNRDILRAARKGKIDESSFTPEQQAAYAKLKDYMKRVNSLDYMKHFTSEQTPTHDKRVKEARELMKKLQGSEPMSAEDARTLSTLLHGDRAQQDTASEARFYNGVSQPGERVVLNADIRDMGLDLFDSMAGHMAGIKEGDQSKPAADRHSSAAADNVVTLKQQAEKRVRECCDSVIKEAIAEALKDGNHALAAQLEQAGEAHILVGGDELTVSLPKEIENAGLLQKVINKLQEVASTRVAVTYTDAAGGRQGHIDAMDRAQPGHDKLKKLEQQQRDLEFAVAYLRPEDAAKAKEYAEKVSTWHTEEVNGEAVLVDGDGWRVPPEMEAEVKQLADKGNQAVHSAQFGEFSMVLGAGAQHLSGEDRALAERYAREVDGWKVGQEDGHSVLVARDGRKIPPKEQERVRLLVRRAAAALEQHEKADKVRGSAGDLNAN